MSALILVNVRAKSEAKREVHGSATLMVAVSYRFSYDLNGNLVINRNIKHVIEFCLSAAREEGRETAIGRINEYIDLTLPAPDQAKFIVERYMDYRQALTDFKSGSSEEENILGELRAAVEGRMALRRDYLDAMVADAFFSESEAYDLYTLRLMDIAAIPELSEEQRLEMVLQAENQLPLHLAEQKRRWREGMVR